MPLPLTISCSSKSRLVLTFLVLPFCYLLTQVVPDIFQKSSKTVVCVCVLKVTELVFCERQDNNHVQDNKYSLFSWHIAFLLNWSSIAERHDFFRLSMLYQRSRCSGQYSHPSFIQEAFQAQADLCRSFSEPLLILNFFCVHLPVRFALSLFHFTALSTITKLHQIGEKRIL